MTCSAFAGAGAPKGKGTKTTAASAPTPAPKTTTGSDTSRDSAQAPSAKEIAVPGADYISCKFTLAELRALQAPDIAPTLSPAEVEQLQIKIVNAAAQNSDPSITGPALMDLIGRLSGADFTNELRGLTPSQALNKVIDEVRQNRSAKVNEEDAEWYASVLVDTLATAATGDPKSTPASAKQATSDAAIKLLNSVKDLGQSGILRSALLAHVRNLVSASALMANEKTAALMALNKSKPLDEQDLLDAARKYLAQLERPPDVGCSMSLLSWREVEFAFGYLIANEYIAVQVVVRNLNEKQEFVLHDVEFEVDADPSGRLGRFYSGRDKIVVRALANTQSTGDPRNLTMSVATGIGGIMSAAQTVFGSPLSDAAGVYNSAFLTSLGKGWKDLSGDQLKMIDDNTFSSTASSQQSVPKSGTVVFYTFIPAKQFQEGWWTQPCVEKTYLGTVDSQGNRSGLSRGVYAQQWPQSAVEKADHGDAPPAGIDVQLALAVCAQPDDLLPRRHSNWSSMLHRGPLLESAPDTCLAEVPSSGAESLPGKSLSRPLDEKPSSSRSVCKTGLTLTKDQIRSIPQPGAPIEAGGDTTHDNSSTPLDKKDVSNGNSSSAPFLTTFDLFRNAYSVPYRKWSPNSLAIFRELANTVVAGVHIVDEDQLQPEVSQLKCPVDDKGVVDFSKVEKDELPCTLTGRNLDKYSKLRLRNAADAVDPQTLDAAVTVTGDNTNAAVNWSAAGLHGLKDSNYLVYAVGLNGAEQKTSQAMHLDIGPYVVKAVNTGTNDANFDGSKGAAAQTLQLSGFHLETVQKLTLTPVLDAAAGNASTRKAVTLEQPKGVAATGTSATFTFDTTSLASLGEGTATLTLQVADTAGSKSTTPKPVPSSIAIAVTVKKPAASVVKPKKTTPMVAKPQKRKP